MTALTKKLLVPDLDETLIHAAEQPLTQPPDFVVNHYFVHKRSGLEQLLVDVAAHFETIQLPAQAG